VLITGHITPLQMCPVGRLVFLTVEGQRGPTKVSHDLLRYNKKQVIDDHS
jgi:hypothetical protein